jgi:hypothetical protein
LSIAGQSADPVPRKHRQKRSIKKKEISVIDAEKSSDEIPVEGMLESALIIWNNIWSMKI